MTPDQWRLEEARNWLTVAARDLRAARILSSSEPVTSVFHSQQAAEKAAKGLLAAHDVIFRKTHDLKELAELCVPLRPAMTPTLEACKQLTDYAMVFRYPDAPRQPDEAEALDAIARAQRLYDEVTAALGLGKS
jgi:HEPN domain-containing protein